MILQFLAEPLIALAEFLVGLFPAFPRFDSLAVTLDPVAYVIRFLLVILIVYNIKFGWSILMWIIRKIPGVS